MVMLSVPHKVPSNSKDSRFFARISTVDKRLIEQAATLLGQSTATFVITQAREAASKVIREKNVIRLNEVESRRLIEALLAPPKSLTDSMKRARKQYRETVMSDVNPNSPALLAKRASARKTVAR